MEPRVKISATSTLKDLTEAFVGLMVSSLFMGEGGGLSDESNVCDRASF